MSKIPTKKHTAFMALLAANITGCGIAERVEDPTDEQQELIEKLYDRALAEQGAMESLLDSVNKNLAFDTSGEVNREKSEQDLSLVYEDLGQYVRDGKVKVYSGEDIKKDESFAGFEHSPLIGEDFIALNTDYMDYWTPGELLHEAAHIEYGPHSDEMNDFLEASSAENSEYLDSPDFVKMMSKEGDYPYLLTTLGQIPDACFREIDKELSVIRYQQEQKSVEGLNAVESSFSVSSDAWYLEQSKLIETDGALMDELGIDHDQLIDALKNSRIFEYRQKVYGEALQEFKQEITIEQNRETAAKFGGGHRTL